MVQLTDTLFRDAHQSLIATRMRTEDMLEALPLMDDVGFFSLEVWGGATFDVSMRFLNEDPWERLRTIKRYARNTKLQMLERAMNIVAYRNFPDDVVDRFIYFAKKNGVDVFRIFDALNDLRNMETPIKATKKYGGHVQAALSFTISPVHTVENYVENFRKLESMGADSLVLKDMAGMISPKTAYEIISQTRDAVKIPVALHSHRISGMTEMAYWEAARAGAFCLDTSLSPFSGATSQPPTESVVSAFKGTEYDTGYDMEILLQARKIMKKVWEKYAPLHREQTLMVDPSIISHQIPGGMFSNLISQLEQQKALNRLDAVLEEVPRVRKDLGYPPLVTPTSQIVGVQAVMNVLSGERYKIVTEETKNYVRGMYGKPPAEISKEIYVKILGPNWQDEVIDVRPADLLKPEYDEAKKKLQEMGLMHKEEDVLTYILYPQVAVSFLKGEIKPETIGEKKVPAPAPKKVASPQAQGPRRYTVTVNGTVYDVVVEPGPNGPVVKSMAPAQANPPSQEKKADAAPQSGPAKGTEIISPMLGVITKVVVKPGDHVKRGQTIAILEAMKMENEVVSDIDGIVKAVYVQPGQEVDSGTTIAVVG